MPYVSDFYQSRYYKSESQEKVRSICVIFTLTTKIITLTKQEQISWGEKRAVDMNFRQIGRMPVTQADSDELLTCAYSTRC